MGQAERISGMRVFCTKLLLLMLCIEMLMRAWAYLDPHWYRQAVRIAGRTPVKYIFIGSSRVACSIIPSEFAREAGVPVEEVINMGAGYSTLVQHYLGLKKIAAVQPGGLQGVTVFLEAPEEVPDLGTWRGNWLYPQGPDLLINVLAVTDLSQFWYEANMGFVQKLSVTAATMSESVARQGGGRIFLSWLKKLVRPDRVAGKSQETDLVEAGGVRIDEEGIQNARRLAIKLAAEHLAKERRFTPDDAERAVLKSLNELIISRGGRLVLYRMPVSSLQKKFHETIIGRANQLYARRLMQTWRFEMLTPEIQTTDDDFPDYWHLRKTRSAEFSRSLAREYGKSGLQLR